MLPGRTARSTRPPVLSAVGRRAGARRLRAGRSRCWDLPYLAPGPYFGAAEGSVSWRVPTAHGHGGRGANALPYSADWLEERTPDQVTVARTRRQLAGWRTSRCSRGCRNGGARRPEERHDARDRLDHGGSQHREEPIIQRDTQQGDTDDLKRPAEAEAVDAKDAAAVRRMDFVSDALWYGGRSEPRRLWKIYTARVSASDVGGG